jgi:hypothetical protein
MPTQANQVRQRRLTSKTRQHIHGGETIPHADRRSGNERPNGIAIERNPFAPVTLPENLSGKLNPFEVATIFGGDSVFASIDNQIKMLPYLNKVCLNLFPDWTDKDWPEGTTLFQMFEEMVNRINAWGADQEARHVGELRWNEGYYVMQSTGDDLVKFCSVEFLAELDKVDPQLTELILITIGKMALRYKINLWPDAAETVSDYMNEQISDLTDYGDTETVAEIERDIELWKTGAPMIFYKRLKKLSKTSLVKVRKKVKAYKWNTYHKKRILAWMRMAERIYTKFPNRTLREYYQQSDQPFEEESLIYPGDYMMFRWSEVESNLIDREYTEFFQAQWQESAISGFRRAFDLATDTIPPDWSDDRFPDWMESWMGMACFICHSKFMKDYNGKRMSKLINILLD